MSLTTVSEKCLVFHKVNPRIVVATRLRFGMTFRTRNSLFGFIARLGKDTPAYQALRSTSLLDVFLIALGNVPQIAQEASGWIRFALTTTFHLVIYGDVLSVVVILG